MEPVDVKADLQALRKLYGLLQSGGDILQNSKHAMFVGKQFDERARIMLKNLLDVATEKALETHSKIIEAAESRVSNSGSYFKSKQSNAIPKLGSPVPYIFKSSPMVGQRNSNCYNLTCRKDELSGGKPTPQEVAPEPSKASISLNRKKRCRVCQKLSVEPQSNGAATTRGDGLRVNGTESVKSNTASLKQKRIYEVGRNPSACSSSPLATGQNKNKPEVARNDFSREIANSIRRIDSGISDLLVKPSEVSDVWSPSQISKKKSQPVTQFPAQPPPATSQHVPPSKQPPRSRPLNHMAHQKVVKSRPLMPPTPPPRQVMATSQRVPPSNAEVAKQPPRPRPLNHMDRHKVVKSRPLMPPCQVIVRPTLMEEEKSTATRMRTRVGPRQRESGESWSSPSSSSGPPASSSSWTNEESSSCSSSDSDESKSFSSRSTSSLVSDQSNSSSSHYRSYHHHRKPDKAIGRLSRLKNKLGLIFHHHHHHHHHHYDHHKGSGNDTDHSKVSCAKHSTWKHMQNMFHHKNRTQKDDKLRKVRQRDHQVKHFHRLVGGLKRQVKDSKKSKPSREGIGGLRNGRKNVHWWEILKRHGGVKVRKKGHVKLGLQSRKKIKNLERR